MAHHEVTDVAGSCGHGGDDPQCRCWGVHATFGGNGKWLSVADNVMGGSYVSAYAAAIGHRLSFHGGVSVRVARLRRDCGDKPAADVAGSCGHGSAYGSKPPDVRFTAMCADCGAWPCDCEAPIWSWRFRSLQHPAGAWRGGHDKPQGERRKVLVDLHAQDVPYGVERGPVQRITDPPFQFASLPTHASSDTNSTRTRTHKCALEWCDTQALSMYCSERCADYSERCGKLVALMTDFEKRTESRRGGQLWAELAWARQRTGNDLIELQRAWQAVQYEAAVGDERFFPLLDDGDA